MVNKQNRELFVPLPPRIGRDRQVEIDAYGNPVSRGPNFGARVTSRNNYERYFNEGNNMNKPGGIVATAAGAAGGAAARAVGNAAREYINNPDFRDRVNTGVRGGVARVIKPAEQNFGTGKGYLSEAPNPAQTSLNTGLKLTIQEKNYTKAQENICAPLHITCALFSFPTNALSQIYNWYNLISTRDYQTRVQEEVNWAVDINTKFSASNITSAMNALFKALQIYFFYRSIDAYCRGGFNQNDAIYSIQSEFDFNTRMKLAEVARLLSRTPIPPNMMEFTRYISSNYYSGESPNSSLLMIVPFPRTSQSVLTSNNNLDSVITDLSNTTYIDVWNTLARAVKSWVPGDPSNLYDPPIEPAFDRDFVTIFNNLPFANGITGKTYSPFAVDVNTAVSYMSWNNNLDGIAVALTDVWNTTTGSWCNGLVIPQASAGYSRYSYYSVSGVTGWYAERTYAFLQNSRLDTYLSDGTTATAYHRYGSDMVINLSGLMISTTAINAVDYWLSKDRIRGVMRDDNPMPRNRRPRPSKRK